MHNKIKRKLLKIGIIINIFFAAIVGLSDYILEYILKKEIKTPSVGIIGGSDGPTKIFISEGSKFYKLPWVILFILLSILCYIGFRKMEK